MTISADSAETRRRPGRPRKFPAAMTSLWGDGRKRRAADMTYATLACTIIGDDASCAWLTEPKDRCTILAELGRLLDETDPETMLLVARRVCADRPSARVGAAYVRSLRRRAGGACGGRGRRPPTDRLVTVLRATIDEALAADPDLTIAAAFAALDDAILRLVLVHRTGGPAMPPGEEH